MIWIIPGIWILVGVFLVFTRIVNYGDSQACCEAIGGLLLVGVGLLTLKEMGLWEKIKEKMEEPNSQQRQQMRQQMKKREAIELAESRRKALERKKSSTKLFMSWEPKSWRDKTNTIYKTSAELWGSYDLIEERWNPEPMTLSFEYEKETYTFKIGYNECMELRNQQAGNVLLGTKWPIKGSMVTVFYYDNDWYFTRADINLDDARVLIEATKKQDQEKLRREIERARNMLEGHKTRTHRQNIPDSVKSVVWNRDGGKCVKCGSREKLEFDHIIPVSKGGSNTARNLQLLCERCNRQKGNRIG